MNPAAAPSLPQPRSEEGEPDEPRLRYRLESSVSSTGALVVAIAAIIISPLLGWLTAARRLSGKIGTSDATELWAESASMRDDYRRQIEALTARVEKLERMNTDLANANGEQAARIGELERENAALKRDNAAMKIRIADLEHQLTIGGA